MTSELLPGTEVLARGLRWEVVFTAPAGEQQLCRLRRLDGERRGEELDLLTPFEKLEPIAKKMDPAKAGRLADWRVYHQAFLLEQALGPNALLAAQPGRLRIAPYQLVPVMRALRMSRVRLLLADGVGLGKTVETGLVLAELIARRRAHRILVVSPAGLLLDQWRREMRDRFGLRFRELNRETLQEIRFQTELGANPFDHEALGLVSIDFAKQERVLQDIERAQWDVVVIDEAHHCTRLSKGEADRDDSQRRRLAEVLARQSDALLLVSATPHDGYDPHFASLMELLDPSLVDGHHELRGDAYRHHVVRRLKRHVKDPVTGKDIFPERVVHPRAVEFDAKTHPRFAAFQAALLELVAPQLRRALRTRTYAEVLAFLALLKRSVSTVQACRNTLQAIDDRLAGLETRGESEREASRQRLGTLREYRRRLERFGTLSFEEEQDHAALEAEQMADELAEHGVQDVGAAVADEARRMRREADRVRRIQAVRETLARLVRLANDAMREDPKPAVILDEIRKIREQEPAANVLVYSEYADSQAVVAEHLDAARKRGELSGAILTICGDDPDDTRTAVMDRFTTEDDLILVSTDAMAEGLNLQHRCHHLLHVELPYNPNRLEQRNGRIDRFGQTKTPEVRYLYLAGTFEERLLLRLVQKFERQRRRLTFVPNTLGVQAGETVEAERLLQGLVNEQTQLFQRPAPIEFSAGAEENTDGTAYRELLSEIDRAFTSFERAAKTHDWLGDAGLSAEERLVREADQARIEGGRLGAGELLPFLAEAVRADSSDPAAVSRRGDGNWELRLPPAWCHGLDDVPGYEREARTLRLTTSLEQTRDAGGRPLGYLGRAHPIVRRALDRVRQVRLGTGGEPLDRRVAAARGDGPEPEVLLTFLGRLQCGSGCLLERVFAVRVPRAGEPAALAEPASWLTLCDPSRAVPPAGTWEKQFASWVPARRDAAAQAALAVFKPIAWAFRVDHEETSAADQRALADWMRQRTQDLCGPLETQADLFDTTVQAFPRWRTAPSDIERITALAADASVPAGKRREASGVVSLYQRRTAALAQLAQLAQPEIVPLGMLLLVPR